MAKSRTSKDVLASILAEAERCGGSLKIRDCKLIYELCGDYEAKFEGVSGALQKTLFLACEMAHDAMIAERNRVGEIVGGVISEDQPDDDFARGWQAAGDAVRVELWDIQPWSGPLAENDNEGDQPGGAA